MRFAKYVGVLLIVAAVMQIGSPLFLSGPRALDAIYCTYFGGSWHCDDHSQSLMVSSVAWERYMLPFSISLLLIGAAMLYGATNTARRIYVYCALGALACWIVVQANYKPKLYEQRNNGAPDGNATPSKDQRLPTPETAAPQPMQTASVTVWTKPERSPATAHTEMYPQEDSIMYLAYNRNGNAVAFSGLDTGLAVQVGGQYSITNQGGFPARYNPRAAFILYDVRNGWIRYSDLGEIGRGIVQHFCESNRLTIYEVINSNQTDYVQGPSPSNTTSVCGRQIRGSSVPDSQPSSEPFNPIGQPREALFGAYTIRLYGDPDDEQSQGSLEILRSGTRVYTDQYQSFEIDSTGAPVGDDVTGMGVPNLVVKEYSGGAHCCTSFVIFELGSSLRKVSTIEQGDCGGGKFQKQADGHYVFNGCDPSSSIGETSKRLALLRYENGAFRAQH